VRFGRFWRRSKVENGKQMKYLLNLPLAVAALAQVWFASLVLMAAPWAGWSDGPSRGAMALVMLEPAASCWALLLLAMVVAAFTDGFDWLPIDRPWLRRALVTGASPLIVALAIPCVLAAIEGSAAVRGHDAEHFDALVGIGAPLVAVLLPFILAGWLAWMIDVPPPLRDAAVPRGIGLGALALTALVGGPLGAEMLADEIRVERATAQRNQVMIDEREVAVREGYAKLTDATPLRTWQSYTDRWAPDAMRKEALQRLVMRPTLEPDLADMLRSSDLQDVENGLILVEQIRFKPSAALAPPLREAIARLAEDIRTSRREGSHDFDSYADSWYPDRLAAAVAVAKKMADSADVDMRDSMHQIQQALAEAYPKSKIGARYPHEVVAADKYVDAALAGRAKAN
jgi:hypothetical protein